MARSLKKGPFADASFGGAEAGVRSGPGPVPGGTGQGQYRSGSGGQAAHG